MLKIGDFSKLSRVSVRMLRHYDDIGLLEAARQRLRKEESINYNVTIRTIPARYAATVHTTIPHYEDEGTVWSTMMSETAHLKLVEADPCLCAVTFLDGEYKETDVEVMAWKTVKGSYPVKRK